MRLYQTFLYQALAVIAMCLCCEADSFALENTTYRNAIDLATFSSETSDGTTVSICPEGQYLYKCGNYRVGFNWLKSATFTVRDTSTPLFLTNDSTKDYYVGDTTLDLYEQMRTFFGHNGHTSIAYKTASGISQATPNEYRIDRERILNNVCNPLNSSITITCARCPNDAKVQESSVQINEDEGLVVQGSWNVYTIADCYMKDFEDSTGSYYYVVPSTENISAECYYTNTNEDALSTLNGDAIGRFVPGLNANRATVSTETISLPSSGSYYLKSF